MDKRSLVSAIAAVLLAVTFRCEAQDALVIEDFDAKLAALAAAYLEVGSTTEMRAQIRRLVDQQAATRRNDPGFLRTAARYLELAGDRERARELFDAIPDDALHDPADVARRLRDQYPKDPHRALLLARRLAGDTSEAAHNLFGDWVHSQLAASYAPTIQSTADAHGSGVVLRGLAERTDTLQSATVATAALAMWVEAQESDDPERLGSLARRAFPDAQSRGSRYQLLLADLLEQRPEPELRAKARSIRQAFLKATGEHIAGIRQPQFIQPDGVLACWMALAYTREAAALRREAEGKSSPRERAGLLSRAFMAEMNAATAMVNGHRPDRSSWDDEAVRLGVGSEYLLTYAVRLQELAERARGEGENAQAAASEEESLVQLIQLTRIDGSGVDLLRAAFVRLRPDARWDEFWQRELTKYAPVVTAETLETATLEKIPIASLRGRWVMLAPWDPSCVSCADNLDGLERLSRASGEVLAVVVGGSAKAAARYLEARGRHLAVASVSPDVARAIGLNSPRYYLLSPDGRLVRLPLHHWEVFARHLLMQPAVPKCPFP